MPINYMASDQSTYTGIDPYTRQPITRNIPGRGGATSTGPYDQSSALGSAYQSQNFDLQSNNRLGQLSDLVNTINRNAQQQSLQARIPGAPALEAQSSQNIGSELQGQLPQDVMNLLGQQAAERGVATGGVGSANANASYLRALGLTSLGQEQQGQQNLSQAYARNPAAPIFDPTTQLITPYQGATIAEANARNNLGVNQLVQQGNLGQQRLNQDAYRYSNPSGYGNFTQAQNPLTGQDLFGPDTSDFYGGGGGYGGTGDQFGPGYSPDSSYLNEIGGYASTPLSMYG